MGLDIIKMEVISFDESLKDVICHFVKENYNNKSCNELFTKYKDFVIEVDEEYHDIEATFKDIGLDYSDYQVILSNIGNPEAIDDDDFDSYFIFANKMSGDRIKIKKDEMLTVTKRVQHLYVKEIASQRQGILRSFNNEFCKFKWTNDDFDAYDENLFILDNEELEKMKLHVTDTSNVKQWELNDNEFIYISN